MDFGLYDSAVYAEQNRHQPKTTDFDYEFLKAEIEKYKEKNKNLNIEYRN